MVKHSGKSRELIGLMHVAEANCRARLAQQVTVWTPEALSEWVITLLPPERPQKREYFYDERR